MKTLINYILSFLVLLFSFSAISAQSISTFAGNGIDGYSGDGGTALTAKLSFIMGLNFDNVGNVLIGNNRALRIVDKITGVISTIAGSDTASSLGGGGNGGPATNAQLLSPYGVCVDVVGNCYIADYWTSTIRKVTAVTGIIDVYAGSTNGNSGDGGPATAAKFAGVTGICIDTLRQYLYISDGWSYRVRRVDMTSGIITAFAGTGTNGFSGDSGPATDAMFSKVFALALDKAGNVYIGDWNNHRIRKVSITTSIVTTIAGNGADGYGGDGTPATAAMLKKPSGICFDTCGNLYFSDEDNNRVRRIDATTGIITTVAGNGTAGFSGDNGPASAAQFNHPTGICIDNNFNLYVGDYYNHRVRKVALGNCNGTGTGIDEVYLTGNRFTFYPNPANNELTITATEKITSVGITNTVGQVVITEHYKGIGKAEVDISHLPVGMYLVKVNDVWVQRFVKE